MQSRLLYTGLASLFVILASSQIPSYVPQNGLMGFWPFTGNANDLTVNQNHGTVFNAVLTSDRFSTSNSAYHFGGSADIKTQYPGVLGTHPRAVSFWARTSHSVTIMCGVAWGTIGTAARYEAGFNYGAPGPMLDGGNGVITYSPPVPAHDNQWHHYVMQFGTTSVLNQVELYQDGVRLTTTSNVYSGTNTLNTVQGFAVRFGSIPGSPDHYFRGDLDDIGIWDRVLCDFEIVNLYSASSGTGSRYHSVPCSTTSLREEQTGVSFYPNPSPGLVYIRGLDPSSEIVVLNLAGMELLSLKAGTMSVFDLGELAPGIYFLRIVSGGNITYQKMIRE
jgi:trimeric autotransporter adhesin